MHLEESRLKPHQEKRKKKPDDLGRGRKSEWRRIAKEREKNKKDKRKKRNTEVGSCRMYKRGTSIADVSVRKRGGKW